MRAVILFVLALCCAVAYAGPPGGFSHLEEKKWGEVTRIIERSLLQLAREQGHHFKLVKLHTVEHQVIAGTKYVADADFENKIGEKLKCHVTLEVQDWKDFDELKMKCLEKEYVVRRGIRA